ncbi:MAG: hypothetical protein D6820_14980 [Lentisphaerae bacterium]|nr:MAG: hypothetical protein D6820_14980 [Lentisphaerota bacterium]
MGSNKKQVTYDLFADWVENDVCEALSRDEALVDDVRTMSRRELIRVVLAWLLDEGACALATNVPTRAASYKVDIAAFWNQTIRNPAGAYPRMINVPRRVSIVEVRRNREECWPDCSSRDELTSSLRELHQKMARIQERIRDNEPHLRMGDALFEEFAQWRYDDSDDPEYHQVRGKIRRIEQMLYRGTMFENIRQVRVADFAWLAVPEGTLEAEEVAEDWGLLWICPDLSVKVVKRAKELMPIKENRYHLANNIALAARNAVLLANGIKLTGDQLYFTNFPRQRRKGQIRRQSHGDEL